jgi:NifU-like protein involved in Fe-S cluster formation
MLAGKSSAKCKKKTDEIEVRLKLDNLRISSIEYTANGCDEFQKAVKNLAKLLKYKTKSEISLLKLPDDHGTETAMQAINDALSTVKDPIDEAMDILEGYNEGLPKEDLKFKYEH